MLLIKNATVHNGLGTCQKQHIYLKDGRFLKITQELLPELAKEAQVIEAEGKHVFPGFINAYTQWGIMGPGWSGDDKDENSNPLTPELDVTYAFDHDGMNFQKVYDYGVTACIVGPLPQNVLAGQVAAYHSFGLSPYKMLIKDRLALSGSVSRIIKESYEGRNIRPMTHMGIFALLRNTLREAQNNIDKKDKSEVDRALYAVLKGEQPLLINAESQAEIEALLKLHDEFPQVSLILMGAYGLNAKLNEALELQKSGRLGSKLQVILGDVTECMNRENSKVDYPYLCSLMAEGYPVAISTGGSYPTSGKESLLWNALQWIRHGLEPEAALTAITSTPAKIFGLDKEIGSIQEGLWADFSIWSGNPFASYEAQLESAYIKAVDISTEEARVSCW